MPAETLHTVFISSTFEDLRKERVEVQKAILRLGCLPIGMELFPSADASAWKFIKDQIDRSDYYIVIVGAKYGSVDKDGVSFTEKEYRYAKEKNKPCLVFIWRKTEPLDAAEREQDRDKQHRLSSFIYELERDALSKSFETHHQLGGEAYYSLERLRHDHPSPGYVRGALHTFYGYEEETRDDETFQNFEIERQPNYSNPNPVSHFWADSCRGSWIKPRVDESGGQHLLIDFENGEDGWPCAIAIRPIQQLAIETKNRRWLLFGAQVADSSELSNVYLGVRIANGWYQHWVFGRHSGIHKCMPVTQKFQTFAIDLRSRWWLFTSDGNHKFGPERFDPAIIGSVMFEVGGKQNNQGPGAGKGSIRLWNIRFSDDPPEDAVRHTS